MQLNGVLTVEDEMCRYDHRQVPIRTAGRNDLSEVELVQHGPPLVVIVRGIPGVNQHE